MIQGFVIRKKFELKRKERGTDKGANSLIYVIKAYEDRNSLRKLILKLRQKKNFEKAN